MKKKILYCIIGLLLLSTVGISFYLTRRETSNDKVAGKLYWNVDGKEHLDPEMGLSKRPADKDGAYRVTFAVDGEHVTYEIVNKKLLHQIDTRTLMGLEFNEDGVVVGVLNPSDVVAGEIAPSYYVMSMEKDKIVTNGMQSGEGIEVEVPLTENTNIWNMKSTAKFIGEKGTPVKDDIVRAFLNEEGEVTDVFIVGVYNPFGSEAIPGYCEHCQQTVGWYEWSNRHTLPTVSAHWRLVYDVECNKRQVQIGEDQHLVLDLNGKTVKNTVNYRTYCTFNAGGSLSILDSSMDQSGKIVARGESNQSGMAVWVRYGTFNLYSGTLDASQAVTTGYGTTVSLDVNTTFNMYGGTIIGGTTKTVPREDGKGYIGGSGGAVSIANGATFNMYGGTIKDGKAVWLKKADGIIIGGSGGNVYIRGGGTMNMEGGEILDGMAQQMAGNVLLGAADAVFTMKNDAVISGGQITELGRNSGNIHIWAGATMNMEGGTVKDGVATAAGGNVTVYGTLNMSSGHITGGKIKEGVSMNALKEVVAENANIHCFNGTFNMTGGYIDGYVRIASSGTNDDGTPKTSKVSISGDSQITGGKKNLTLFGGVVIDMGKLGSKANITMTSGGFVTGETLASNVTYVHSDLEGLKAEYIDSKIFIGKMQCICGGDDRHYGDCDGTKLPWKPWSDEASLPRDNDNYFLTCDVKLEKEVSVATDSTLRIDLNGYKIYGANNKRVFQVTNSGSKLIVTNNNDTRTGRIVAKGTETESFNGMCIWLGGKENYAAMYAGILDASDVISQKGGPALFVAVNNTFDMFGGTISGGLVKKNAQNAGGSAGTVYVNGILNMWNGLIYSGAAEGNGGNIYVANGATLNLRGGRINGGKSGAKGGNIHSHGIVNMYEGAYVEKGESVGAGGNILIAETSKGLNGTLNMYGGTVANGSAGQQGGNIAFEGNFKMTGGLISDGTSGKKNSENVAIWQRQDTDSFEMTGGKINGGVAFMTNSDAPETSIIKAVLSGISVIKSPKKEAVSLLIPNGNQITVGDLKEGADIWVTGKGEIASDALSTDVEYIHVDYNSSYEGGASVAHCATDNTLVIGQVSCLCGHVTSTDKPACIGKCDGTLQKWIPTVTIPTKSGYYYLVKDIEVTDTAIIASDMDVNLDLNGHTVTNKNEKRLITISSGTSLKTTNTKLNLVDHAGEGSMYLTNKPNGNGGIVWLQGAGNEVSIYSGTYDASAVNCTYYGVAVAVTGTNESVFRMYGGNIIGGTTSRENNVGGYGGAVYVNTNNKFEMTGGKITGGRAQQGGNVYIAGSMELSGGAIISGGMKNTAGDTPSGATENVCIAQGAGETNSIKFADCTVEGLFVTNLVSPIEATSETIISSPEGGYGLMVNQDTYTGTWMTWSGPEYTENSKGRISIYSIANEGVVVMDKGVRVADRELFRDYVTVRSGYKLWFSEVTLDEAGNPTGRGAVVMTNSGAHIHCACGGTTEVCTDGTKAHNEIKYTSITSDRDLPNTAGNYYLKHNVNLTSTETVASGEYNLCLNGYQLTGTTVLVGNANKGRYGSGVFKITGGTLNATNCAEKEATIKAYSKWQSVDNTGTITGTMNFAGAGGVFAIDGGTVNCYKLNLDANDWYLPNGWTGSVVHVKSGTLTGYNCTYTAGRQTNVNLNNALTATSNANRVDAKPFVSGAKSSEFKDLGLPVTAFREKTSE